MQNTFTGYILIVFVFFIYFIRFGFFSKALILSLGFFLLMFIFYIYKNYEVFGNFGVLIKVKADSLILGGTDEPIFLFKIAANSNDDEVVIFQTGYLYYLAMEGLVVFLLSREYIQL
ncbi:Uncharacterised protein [Klebsiella pneumoniae subsp. rhinoscleromatis]|nr:Uncharacterised protein [Klebsiella pneumoniae subsp. rhinoscleromatis]